MHHFDGQIAEAPVVGGGLVICLCFFLIQCVGNLLWVFKRANEKNVVCHAIAANVCLI